MLERMVDTEIQRTLANPQIADVTKDEVTRTAELISPLSTLFLVLVTSDSIKEGSQSLRLLYKIT